MLRGSTLMDVSNGGFKDYGDINNVPKCTHKNIGCASLGGTIVGMFITKQMRASYCEYA